MAATKARQGGRVQLEQSKMCLTLNLAKMAKAGFTVAAMDKTQFVRKTPCTKVLEAKTPSDKYPGHIKVKSMIARHLAIHLQHHMARYLLSKNVTATIPQARWRWITTDPPPSDQRRQRTAVPMPPLHGTAPVPTGNNA